MIDYSFGYETNDGHHGLGTSEAAPPIAFTVRRHDTENPNSYEEIVYMPEQTCEMIELENVRWDKYEGVADGARRCSLCGALFIRNGDVTRPNYCPNCGAKVIPC